MPRACRRCARPATPDRPLVIALLTEYERAERQGREQHLGGLARPRRDLRRSAARFTRCCRQVHAMLPPTPGMIEAARAAETRTATSRPSGGTRPAPPRL